MASQNTPEGVSAQGGREEGQARGRMNSTPFPSYFLALLSESWDAWKGFFQAKTKAQPLSEQTAGWALLSCVVQSTKTNNQRFHSRVPPSPCMKSRGNTTQAQNPPLPQPNPTWKKQEKRSSLTYLPQHRENSSASQLPPPCRAPSPCGAELLADTRMRDSWTGLGSSQGIWDQELPPGAQR